MQIAPTVAPETGVEVPQGAHHQLRCPRVALIQVVFIEKPVAAGRIIGAEQVVYQYPSGKRRQIDIGTDITAAVKGLLKVFHIAFYRLECGVGHIAVVRIFESEGGGGPLAAGLEIDPFLPPENIVLYQKSRFADVNSAVAPVDGFHQVIHALILAIYHQMHEPIGGHPLHAHEPAQHRAGDIQSVTLLVRHSHIPGIHTQQHPFFMAIGLVAAQQQVVFFAEFYLIRMLGKIGTRAVAAYLYPHARYALLIFLRVVEGIALKGHHHTARYIVIARYRHTDASLGSLRHLTGGHLSIYCRDMENRYKAVGHFLTIGYPKNTHAENGKQYNSSHHKNGL